MFLPSRPFVSSTLIGYSTTTLTDRTGRPSSSRSRRCPSFRPTPRVMTGLPTSGVKSHSTKTVVEKDPEVVKEVRGSGSSLVWRKKCFLLLFYGRKVVSKKWFRWSHPRRHEFGDRSEDNVSSHRSTRYFVTKRLRIRSLQKSEKRD